MEIVSCEQAAFSMQFAFVLIVCTGFAVLPGDAKEFTPPLLVQARVTKTSLVPVEGGYTQESTWQVDHVFSGDSALKGKLIDISSISYALGGQPFNYYPPLQAGQVIICELVEFQGKLGIDYNSRKPLRKGVDPEYDAVSIWALSVENVYNAPIEQREALLKERCFSSNPWTCIWAIRCLGSATSLTPPTYLYELVSNSKLPVAAQVELDSVLATQMKEKWTASPERRTMLIGWMNKRLAETVENCIVQHVNETFQSQDIPDYVPDYETMLEMAKQVMGNPHASYGFRGSFHSLLYRIEIPTNSDHQSILFNLLMERVAHGPTPEERVDAGRSLLILWPLTQEQGAEIYRVMQSTKDSGVAEVLDELLSRPDAPSVAGFIPRYLRGKSSLSLFWVTTAGIAMIAILAGLLSVRWYRRQRHFRPRGDAPPSGHEQGR